MMDWTGSRMASSEMNAVEIRICRLHGAAEVAAHYAPLLSPEELERAHRFAFQHLRDEYILGRGLTRCILGTRIGVPPQSIRFYYSSRGKPYLQPRNEWHFNVSHSKSLFVCAMTTAGEVGVDIERVRPMEDALKIARQFFCESENWRLQQLPEEHQATAFFECWTRKEAFLKATGEGLTRELDSFAVTFGPGEAPRFERIDDPADDPSRWSLKAFAPAESYVGAVAVRAPIGELRLQTIDPVDAGFPTFL
jgi:4'-phosphopantetheinyl transferase